MLILQREPGAEYAAHLTVDAPIETAFTAVSTVDGLRTWWTEHTEGSAESGGKLRFDQPAGVAGHELTFELAEVGSGRTELRFTHAGLQPQLECYGSCSAGWDYYLRSLAS